MSNNLKLKSPSNNSYNTLNKSPKMNSNFLYPKPSLPSLSTTTGQSNLPDAKLYLQSKLSYDDIQNNKSQLSNDEFGVCNNQDFRFDSTYNVNEEPTISEIEEPSYFILISTYVSYVLLIVIGHMRDFFGKRMFHKHYKHLMPNNG